jgi:N-acetylglutamate synthase-like GNAT family acetyltransferase
MPLKIIDYGTFQYQQMIDLRNNVLRVPLGLVFSEEELAAEKEDFLLGCFDEEKLEGCCILTKIEKDVVRLRQMAVLDGLQGKGIGKALIQFAENVARDAGIKKITMHARIPAVGFYEKLGYTILGDVFTEVSIPHVELMKHI